MEGRAAVRWPLMATAGRGFQHKHPQLTSKLLHLDQGVLGGRALQELLCQPAATRLQEPEEQGTTCEVFLPKENGT